eukprot:3890562-Pleurochrysis_carterae.AAC.1
MPPQTPLHLPMILTSARRNTHSNPQHTPVSPRGKLRKLSARYGACAAPRKGARLVPNVEKRHVISSGLVEVDARVICEARMFPVMEVRWTMVFGVEGSSSER